MHATVAGVLLGVRRAGASAAPQGPGPGLAEHFEHRCRPLSAGVAVPVFALLRRRRLDHRRRRPRRGLTDPITLGIVVGLVVGKTVGVLGATWLVQRFTRARLAEGLSWWDVLGLALLAGIGFTVSLLIGELAFGAGTEQRRPRQDRRPGSARCWPRCSPPSCSASATATTGACGPRRARDTDADGVPDVYQMDEPHN